MVPDSSLAVDTDPGLPAWKILVVDDEPAVHQVTRLALRNLMAMGRPSQLINALSSADAREQLQRHPDIALALVDVVMETETAGLDLVRYIRDELRNDLLRIVLRTGQPGQAPERQVMIDYDINDYREKTELTSNKLFTTVLAGLRTYQLVHSLARLRRGVQVLAEVGELIAGTQDPVALCEHVVRMWGRLGIEGDVSCEVLQGDGVVRARSELGTGPPAGWPEALRDAAGARRGHAMQVAGLVGVEFALDASGLRLCIAQSSRARLGPQDMELLEVVCGSLGVALKGWQPAQAVRDGLPWRRFRHELNAQLGVAVTALSVQQECVDTLGSALKGQVELEPVMDDLREATSLARSSLDVGLRLIQAGPKPAYADDRRPLHEVAQHALNMQAHKHPGIQLCARIDLPREWTAEGEALAWHQIFSNLMDNSLRHGLSGRAEGTISITGRQVSPTAREIDVRDDGTGLAGEVAERAFEEGFSTQPRADGGGHGLGIVRELLAERLRGQVRFVASDVGAHVQLQFEAKAVAVGAVA